MLESKDDKIKSAGSESGVTEIALLGNDAPQWDSRPSGLKRIFIERDSFKS